MIVTLGCSSCIRVNNSFERIVLPTKSFVFVKMVKKFRSCKDNVCIQGRIGGASGSSVVVLNTEDGSVILTAEHVCKYINEETIDEINHRTITYSYTLTDYFGNTYTDLTILKSDPENDICLVHVKNMSLPPVEIETDIDSLKYGTRVYNMAAPLGLFSPGTVILFEGFYTGISPHGNSVFTIPTQGGSSGSPILNSENKLVGIIHSKIIGLENIGLSSTLKNIKKIMNVYLENNPLIIN
jgi:S1-C subfamily serine protease